MIRRFLAASATALACLACLGLGACSTTAPPHCVRTGTSDIELLNFSREWIEAFNAHDAKRLVGLYAENAYVSFGKGSFPTVADYTQLFESRPTIRITPPSQAVYKFDEDIAFMEREVEITEDINGSTESRNLKFAMSFRYRDGHWQIYAHVCPDLI